MVKTYSLKKDGSNKLSANFVVSEFACKDGSDKVLIDDELVAVLQKIRTKFKKPVEITSAYRHDVYNKKIGGASNSQHTKGKAADMYISGVEPEDIVRYAEYLMPNMGGIGLYGNFVHIDVRSARARWKNFGKEVWTSGFPGYVPEKLDNVNDIVWELNHRGIISDTELWLKKLKKGELPYELAKNAANETENRREKLNLTTINDIIWELNHRGLIQDKGQWEKLMYEDENLKWLALKICNLTINK